MATGARGFIRCAAVILGAIAGSAAIAADPLPNTARDGAPVAVDPAVAAIVMRAHEAVGWDRLPANARQLRLIQAMEAAGMGAMMTDIWIFDSGTVAMIDIATGDIKGEWGERRVRIEAPGVAIGEVVVPEFVPARQWQAVQFAAAVTPKQTWANFPLPAMMGQQLPAAQQKAMEDGFRLSATSMLLTLGALTSVPSDFRCERGPMQTIDGRDCDAIVLTFDKAKLTLLFDQQTGLARRQTGEQPSMQGQGVDRFVMDISDWKRQECGLVLCTTLVGRQESGGMQMTVNGSLIGAKTGSGFEKLFQDIRAKHAGNLADVQLQNGFKPEEVLACMLPESVVGEVKKTADAPKPAGSAMAP